MTTINCFVCLIRASVVVVVLALVVQIRLVEGNTNTNHRYRRQTALSKRSRPSSRQVPTVGKLYNLGLSVDQNYKKARPVQKLKLRCQHAFDWLCANRVRLFHLFVFVKYSHCTVESILEDSWEAERNPDKYFGKTGIIQSNERSVVKRRVVSSSTIRKIVGAGYTPRLVFLFGVMLRGIIHCTAIPKIFEVRWDKSVCK